MEASKINSIIERSGNLLENKQFYEYEQKMKTLANRYVSSQKYEEAIELLLKAAKNLLTHQETNAGFELANMCLTMADQKKIEFSEDAKNKLTEFLLLSKFDKQKLRFCNNLLNRVYPNGNEKIFEYMGLELLQNKIYHFAQKYLIHGNNVEAEIKLLTEWRQQGKPEEADFFIARYILMKLCTKKIKECLTILKAFEGNFQRKPVLNFLQLLTQTVEIGSRAAFKKIIENYEKVYNLDASFATVGK